MQNKINAYLKDRDSVNEIDVPQWVPNCLLNHTEGYYNDNVTIKLLCGADLLESFATPGLWQHEDVSSFNSYKLLLKFN